MSDEKNAPRLRRGAANVGAAPAKRCTSATWLVANDLANT